MVRAIAGIGIVAAAVLITATSAVGAPQGSIYDQCVGAGASHAVNTACYLVDKAVQGFAAHCRRLDLVEDEACSTPISPEITEAQIVAFEESDLARALEIQRTLSDDVELLNATWLGTHNSANSQAEMGVALSAQDFNQHLSIRDQLRLGARFLEIDVHMPIPYEVANTLGVGLEPVVCHGEGQGIGCTVEKPLSAVLADIERWLAGHPGEILMIYLEDHLGNVESHDIAEGIIDQTIGHRVYHPESGCTTLASTLRRSDVRAAGKQVVLVGGCGSGRYSDVVYDWSRIEGRPQGYQAFPMCDARTRQTYDENVIRYYDDVTWLTTAGQNVGQSTIDEGLTPVTVGQMMRCGVDVLNFDNLLPDARWSATLWSWSPDHLGSLDGAGNVIAERHTGAVEGWIPSAGGQPRHFSCRAADGSWVLTTDSFPGSLQNLLAVAEDCSALEAALDVPRNGYEDQRLRSAMVADGVSTVYLPLRRQLDGTWIAEQ